MRIGLALIGGLWLAASAHPAARADWSDVVAKLETAIVYVESNDGACTGFVIDTVRKYVLTAAHCDGKELYADRVTTRVVSKDSKKDLMVLEAKDLDPTRKALKLAPKDPEIGEEVMSAGFGYALERPMFRKANISDTAVHIPEAGIGGPYISTDAPFIGGQSGGPIVNTKGEVVSIVQRASNMMGIGVGAMVIKDRMGRFFGA